MAEDVHKETVMPAAPTLRPSETSLVIQAKLEGLAIQQLLARDLLVDRCGISRLNATDHVKELSADAVVLLKEVLQKAENPVRAFDDFRVALAREIQERTKQ